MNNYDWINQSRVSMKNLVKMEKKMMIKDEKMDKKNGLDGWMVGWVSKVGLTSLCLLISVYYSLGIKFIPGNPTLSTLDSRVDPREENSSGGSLPEQEEKKGGEGREEAGFKDRFNTNYSFSRVFVFPQLTAIYIPIISQHNLYTFTFINT